MQLILIIAIIFYVAKKWNKKERKIYKDLLYKLYIKDNKTIKEIGLLLGVSEKTIFKRLKILNIKTIRSKKLNYCNKRHDIKIPKYSIDLAEFFGIMLGDGKLSPTQILVTLGNKEKDYVFYVQNKFKSIFGAYAKISIRKTGYRDVYLGSVEISRWLKKEGLVYNKVKSQVDVPNWIFTKKSYCRAFVRGFFDTDGSVYKLKYGNQISLTNNSLPLLKSLQKMLFKLQYKPSSISSCKIYMTKKEDISRFFREIKPQNAKHLKRFNVFSK